MFLSKQWGVQLSSPRFPIGHTFPLNGTMWTVISADYTVKVFGGAATHSGWLYDIEDVEGSANGIFEQQIPQETQTTERGMR